MRFSLLLLVFLLAACAPLHAPPPPLSAGMARTLLARLDADARAFHSLQGLAKVRVHSGDRSFSASQVLLAKKPDRLRSEVLSPFGQPMLLMATDGRELEIQVPAEGRFYHGPATPAHLQRFTRLPLHLDDLVHLLLYQVPLVGRNRPQVAALRGGLYRLRLQGEGGERQELFFDTQLRLLRTAYYREGKLLLLVRYGGFTGGGHPFPGSIDLEMPPEKTRASLEFSEVQTNVALPADRFVLTPPAGAKILPLP